MPKEGQRRVVRGPRRLVRQARSERAEEAARELGQGLGRRAGGVAEDGGEDGWRAERVAQGFGDDA